MSLKLYRKKRELAHSGEPAAYQKPHKGALNFCIQKHHARHLHYDLRLEFNGILLSWAIPKGPSMHPKDKRLAVKVEDHPLDYQYFEGTIPKGNYGAGTVEIWDAGTYTVPNAKNKKEAETLIRKGLKKGHLDIMLEGDKVYGRFVLQHFKSDKDNTWLLIKAENGPSASQKKQPKTKMPSFIPPMLAISSNNPFNDEEWLFELKWDGYRALASIHSSSVELKSRSKQIWDRKFPSIIEELKKIKDDIILDGELVVLDSKGKPEFQLMQNYQKTGEGNLYYYVFDLLYKNGEDMRELPLIERKKALKELLDHYALSSIRYSDHVVTKGKEFFKEIAKRELEGMIAKKMSSSYQSRRSSDWIKIKTKLRQEFVIGGFTQPRGTRKKFGALLVGFYKGGQLHYAGHVGGGFNAQLLNTVYAQLKPLIQPRSPFAHPPQPNTPATWVNPKLVCEVSFAQWTQEHLMRQPIFHGLREDKAAKAVTEEVVVSKKSSKNSDLTNLDKIYWPEEGYTKGDLIAYYREVAPFILPYLKNRPIMLHRYPNGIEGNDFYQKDLATHPDWIKTCAIDHEGKQDHYLLINNLKSLLYAINLGSIDLHPFLSKQNQLEYPDYCVIDLDPHNITFDYVVETALCLHAILEEAKVRHFCKTSGGKGLHIFIPLHAKYDFEQSRQFAEIVALLVHKELPHITSLERSPKKRNKKIYIDYMQNRSGQTVVAPYAVRPRSGALVSTPLLWEEVNKNLDPKLYNIKTLLPRLKEKDDLFKGVLGSGINLKATLSRFALR